MWQIPGSSLNYAAFRRVTKVVKKYSGCTDQLFSRMHANRMSVFPGWSFSEVDGETVGIVTSGNIKNLLE